MFKVAIGTNKKRDMLHISIFALGITSTMPIVGIPLGSSYIKVFDIIFACSILLCLLTITSKKPILSLDRLTGAFLLFLGCPILGFLVGMLSMPPEWNSSMKSYLIKTLMYIIFLMILNINDNEQLSECFARGLMIGIIINCIWSICEGMSFYIFAKSLNDYVFARYLGRGIIIVNKWGGFRASGLNYDPAHLGGIIPILFCYSILQRKYVYTIIAIISLVFSQSTTALVGCVVSIVCVFLFHLKRVEKKKDITKKILKVLKIITICILTIILLIVIIDNIQNSKIIEGLFKNFSGYIDRINNIYIQTDKTDPRSVYYLNAFEVLSRRSILAILFGTGLGTSMYPYRNYDIFQTGEQRTVTEIETNYLAYLFDLGILGLILYIIVLTYAFNTFKKLLSKNNKIEIRNVLMIFLSTIISIISSSFFYHYIFTSYQMLALTFGVLYAYKIKIKIREGE